jgi:hypothetical protein
MSMTKNRFLLVGCGILEKDIRYLAEKNGWPLDTDFVDSTLHIDFGKLKEQLTDALNRHRGRDIIVFYGACHPLIDQMLEAAGTYRTEGQNCVEMLLGHDVFEQELSQGAFFLLEDWARRWDHILSSTFDNNLQVAREIFQSERKYLLCLRTPCSGDFEAEAEEAGRKVGLPVKWMDVSLDHLESVIQAAIDRKARRRP